MSTEQEKSTGRAPSPESNTEETENAIRPVRRRKPEPPAPAATAASQDASGKRKGAPVESDVRLIPDGVREKFLGIGSKFYFRDGTLAFVDKGVKLTAHSQNTEVIRSMIAIAKARAWDTIQVSGSEHFRREAWFAAHAENIKVRGYKPTAVEQAQLVRSLTKQRAAAMGEAQDPEKFASAARARKQSAEAREAKQARQGATFTGQLLAHETASYRHDPMEQGSYLVRLKTKDGEREVWGIDLERAIRQSLSNVKIGDQVTVRAVRREPVSVPALKRDDHGQVIGQEMRKTHRNEWIVERSDFLAERQQLGKVFRDEKIEPLDAVKKHPELQGSYLKLQAARLLAERDFKDPKDRLQLVQRARVIIADSIERGEPLEPVRLRDVPHRKPPEREQAMHR